MKHKQLSTQLSKKYGFDINVTEIIHKETDNSIGFASSSNGGLAVKLLNMSETKDNIEQQISWQAFLSDNGVQTPRVYHSINEELVESVLINDEERLCIVMERIDGAVLSDKELTTEIFRKVGRETAKMHNLSEKYHARGSVRNIMEWKDDPYLVPNEYLRAEDGLVGFVEQILAEVSNFPKDQGSYGLVHSDLQPHNFILSSKGLYVIDFESIMMHWFIIDFISTLEGYIGNIFDKDELLMKTVSITKNYFLGYLGIRDVSEVWIKNIPLFYLLWEVVLYNNLTEMWDMDNLTAVRKKWLSASADDIRFRNRFEGIDFLEVVFG